MVANSILTVSNNILLLFGSRYWKKAALGGDEYALLLKSVSVVCFLLF